MKILLVYPANAGAVDGIRDYATHVAEQLRHDGDDARLLRPKCGLGMGPTLVRALPKGETAAVIVQYNPFAWGRWGLAPSLPLALALVRLGRPKVRVITAVHEAYVPVRDFRSLLMSTWQRAQMRILLALSHSALAMTGHLTDELSRGWPHRRVKHVPVGSNLPDERAARGAARGAAGYEGRLVVASLSTGHESHLGGYVARAAAAVAENSAQPTVLLLLGKNNVLSGEGVRAVERTVAPGFLDARSLARALSTADLFLAPFADGASTRRTSLMAALQHGIATITTRSEHTDVALAESEAFGFAAVDDLAGFVAQATRMGADAETRAERALAGRALFERHFSWPALCAGLREAIAAVCETAS